MGHREWTSNLSRPEAAQEVRWSCATPWAKLADKGWRGWDAGVTGGARAASFKAGSLALLAFGRCAERACGSPCGTWTGTEEDES